MKPLSSLLEILTIGTLVITLQASVTLTYGASPQVSEGQTLMALEREAATLRSTRPEMWQSYLDQTSRVFVEHEKRTCWQCREAPPPADLTSLKLPLFFLAAEVRQQKDILKLIAYLDAIVLNSDPRRINLLIELQAKRGERSTFRQVGWARLIADAAELDWAAVKIRELLKADPPLDSEGLLESLLWRFTAELPRDVRATAYDYIRRHWREGPNTHLGGEAYWDLLLCLDAERARAEIIPYFEKDEYSLYVVLLLKEHAGPSAQVAGAVRRWLTTDAGKGWPDYMYILLLKSDPQGGLRPMVAYIDGRVAEYGAQKSEDDLGAYVQAMLEINSAEAVQPLARYANEQVISDIARLDIIEWLVKRRYEKVPHIVARWLAKEPDYRRSWLLQKVTKNEWGEFGRQVLREAEAINQRKMPFSH